MDMCMKELFSETKMFLEDFRKIKTSFLEGLRLSDSKNTDVKKLDYLINEMQELQNVWDKRQNFGDYRIAAEILANMINQWGCPGGVCYYKEHNSFRLVAEEYSLREGEEFLGVFLPGCGHELIYEEIQFCLGLT